MTEAITLYFLGLACLSRSCVHEDGYIGVCSVKFL